ncbi:MAG: DUF72 domain-containing protein [Myxococcaceae bacterium]
MIRYGPAGFDYRDWEGRVYPTPRRKDFDRLGFLARFLDTLEINSSFYGPPRPETAGAWIERVRANPRFRFSLKLWRRFTHERDTAWTQAEVDEARASLEVMSEHGRLGAVLLQFPWSFRRTDENEDWLQDLISTFKVYPLVVEVRHLSWAVPEFFTTLLERGVGTVNIDQPRFANSIKPGAVATAATGYVRLHGRNYRDWFRAKAGRDERYDYLYSAEELRPWAGRIQEVASSPRTKDTYVVTNNHYLGKAPANALMLQSLVEERVVDCPEPLFQTYGDALRGYARPVGPLPEPTRPPP